MSSRAVYTLLLGLFLGFAIVKFGNPVVLEGQLEVPRTLAEFWGWPWPLRWARAAFLPLAVVGLLWSRPGSVLRSRAAHRCPWPLWVLPLLWLAWQYLAARDTVDPSLTQLVLPHFAATVACFFLGFLGLREVTLQRWLWPGLLAGVAFCLVKAVNQYAIEFPTDLATYRESERTGWTNTPPAMLDELKRLQLVFTTNGVDLANPVILKKLEKGRVYGTLVYPNALAAILLLLLPPALVLAWTRTRDLRPGLRLWVMGLTALLGGSCFFWTGSKAGWLVALGVGGVALLFRPGSARTKTWAVAAIVGVGLAVFFARHAGYFRQGATSASARVDYWRAAWATANTHPWFGTGPGTFQRPYSAMKSPEQEMARLVHNDYLEQASDSGWPGALLYTGWIGGLLWTLGRRCWQTPWTQLDPLNLAVWLGLLGWFLQATAEFSLYIPALAWTAFLLAGMQLGTNENQSTADHPEASSELRRA